MTIGHIALYVEDLENEKNFFETYFNGKAGPKYHNEKTGFTSYFISFGNDTRLEIMNMPGLKKDKNSQCNTGYIHIAFNTGSKENVNVLTEKLRTDGYKVVSGPRTTGDGYYESCIEDKEGNLVEITI
ncbi:MAG: hypothetical protein HFH68_00955 [Lachnospiraceae bacterium]|nr:hypothetical protein [Lachnospiraceae bacterium]